MNTMYVMYGIFPFPSILTEFYIFFKPFWLKISVSYLR